MHYWIYYVYALDSQGDKNLIGYKYTFEEAEMVAKDGIKNYDFVYIDRRILHSIYQESKIVWTSIESRRAG